MRDLPGPRQLEADVKALRVRLDFARIAEVAPDPVMLAERIAADPRDCEARYDLAARRLVQGDYDTAMEQFLAIMGYDRAYRDDGGRKGLLGAFALLHDGDPDEKHRLIGRYRARMSALLY